jgi:hypothetical protein
VQGSRATIRDGNDQPFRSLDEKEVSVPNSIEGTLNILEIEVETLYPLQCRLEVRLLVDEIAIVAV